MRFFSLIFATLLFSLSLFAQSPSPSPTPVPTPVATPTPGPNDGITIDLGASYSSVSSTPSVLGSNSTTSATVLTLRAPVTDKLSGRLENITLPGQASITFAEAEYRLSAASLLKFKNLKFNPKNYQVFAYGGFGGKQTSLANAGPAFSYIAGGGLDRLLPGNFALRIVDLAYVHAGVGQGVFLSNNHFAAATGLNLHF